VQVVERLRDYLASSASEVITIDGLKALIDENSWVLVRPSNTEHAIRVSVEAKADDVQGLYKAISEKVKCVYEQIK
jgi:phosphomannomutase